MARLPARASDEDGQVVRWGRLGVLNNQWGAALGHADAASFQRIRVEDSSVVFEFDWRNKTPADGTWVKAFPSIVAGWHFGVPVYPGDPTLPNLPVQLSKKPKLMTTLRAVRSGGSDLDVMNLAWDIWLTSSKPDPSATSPVAPAATQGGAARWFRLLCDGGGEGEVCVASEGDGARLDPGC